ncbi:hypothetical protein I302_104042 [Kwoniella bestiolae CBS 10118]|uniref:Uncharacterized protein n=1 Tax=Kwoniella bestiolae CBS 10118 TaxID=1296100 RepID=A0A1B9GA47_9TREE|nr:hypothetical protein I302_02747 [Kwoniella bestiolae CBS 10118]OCF27897.1 hypothetical protein I302_02747 [Kwoniella bestiolae CBS 10118]
MDCLSSCLTGRMRFQTKVPTARYGIRGLVAKTADEVTESVAEPIAATRATLYKGYQPTLLGTDKVCAIGFLPQSKLEDEVRKGYWDEGQLRASLETSSKLIPCEDAGRVMKWGLMMTKTDDISGLIERSDKRFDSEYYNRIFSAHNNDDRNAAKGSSNPQDPSILHELLNSAGADPRKIRDLNVIMCHASYQPEQAENHHDFYLFGFTPAATQVPLDQTSMDLFEQRQTNRESEDRFLTSFDTALSALAILSQDDHSNIYMSYYTKDDFHVKITGSVVEPNPKFSVRLTNSRSHVTEGFQWRFWVPK